MIGYGNWWAGGVVGDKADLGTSIMKLGDPFRGTRNCHRAQIDHAIKIEKSRVVGVNDSRGRAHR
jgi:hypothetical protein